MPSVLFPPSTTMQEKKDFLEAREQELQDQRLWELFKQFSTTTTIDPETPMLKAKRFLKYFNEGQ
jgi:hypothetical protein